MKAAVFYEPEQIQLEDVPDPSAGDDEVVVRVRACGFCGSDIEYYYGKSPLGTPDGKGPLVLGPRAVRRGRRGGQAGGELRARGGRPSLGQPRPELQRLRHVPRGQGRVLPEHVGDRRDDERRVRGVREDEDRARVQAPRVADGRAGRVRRDALLRRLRGPARRGRAGQPRGRLRPGPGRPVDGAAAEERGRAGRARRHPRLPARRRQVARRRLRLEHAGRARRRTGRRTSPRRSRR